MTTALLSKDSFLSFATKKPFKYDTQITDENGNQIEATVYIKRMGLGERDAQKRRISALFGKFDKNGKPENHVFQSEIDALNFCYGVVDADNNLVLVEDGEPLTDAVKTFDGDFVADVTNKIKEINYPEMLQTDEDSDDEEAEDPDVKKS